MDTLHTVLRAMRGEAKPRCDHLAVFREFLDHLERIGRAAAERRRPVEDAKPNGARNGKR
jgi:hypothetical protein